MSARYTQSKSEAAKHSQILRDMLKRPENKVRSLAPARAVGGTKGTRVADSVASSLTAVRGLQEER